MNSQPIFGDILIADDTLPNLRLLSQMLTERGYQVRAALNGTRALAAVQSAPPDLILLDIMMPDMDGYEVCRRLKADDRTRDIPVLFISALSETEDKIRGFAVGGLDYITKPFQLEEVLARVETHLKIRRLQMEVRQQEEVARALLNASPDAAYLVKIDGTILTSNHPGAEELGQPIIKLPSKRIWDLLSPEVAQGRRARADEVVRSGVPVRFEDEGDNRYLDNVIYPLFDDQGTVDRIAIYIRDITERKVTEEKNLQLAALVESSDDAIVGKTMDGIITSWNLGAEKIYGYIESEVLGKPISILVPDEFRDEVPEILEEIRQGRHIDHYETLRLRKDGKRINVSLTISPIYSIDGKIIGASTIAHDITIRKLAEEELRRLEQEFRELVEHSPDVIARFDRNLRHLYVSPAIRAVTGLSPDVFIGKTKHELGMPSELCDQWDAAILKAFETGQASNIEFAFPHENGIQYYESRIIPEFDSDGAIQSVLNVSHNITERKQMEEMLEQKVLERTAELARSNELLHAEIAMRKHAQDLISASLKEKEMLLREVHHRVKNNLQVISSLLYLQSKKAADKHTLEIFKDSQNRIKSMVMVHERLSVTQHAKINFADYIKSLAINLFQSYDIQLSTIALKLDLEEVLINMDTAVPCGLIVNELVSNSIKHAFPDGRKGEICIELQSEGDSSIHVIISDDGVGIKSDIKRPSTLGLQLVNTLVRQIDGRIKIDISRGTKFEICFKELNYRERC